MEKIELAKKALESVQGMSFNCMVGCYEGGKCGDSYTDYQELDLSREEVLYLINKPQFEEVFAGLKMEPVDVEATLTEMAYESSWPDGGAHASVNEIIPEELKELNEKLNNLDVKDAVALEDVRSQLKGIKDGEYTFRFDVYDGNQAYCFGDDVQETINISGNEARALLKHEHDIPAVFDEICSEELDEDFINEKAEEAGIAERYDYLTYSYNCDELDNFIDSWNILITKIMSGEIVEDELDTWLEYFNDSDNFEDTIDDWKTWQE